MSTRAKFVLSSVKILGAYLLLAVVLSFIALLIMVLLDISVNFDFTSMLLSTILLIISLIDFVRVVWQVPKFVNDGTFIGSNKSPASTAAAFTMSVFVMSAALTLITWIRFLNGLSAST
ncbi:hypothetical protein GCM10009786_00430 [Leucobacter alluvii]|uniref:Uncharacterized protein n=1 Tax=Leucobacter alluvii TaxID=340321 RepID=A0ABN3B288_9MICO